MHFKVEQEIFEKLPNACFGVVVAKGIDNTKDYPQIYDCTNTTTYYHFISNFSIIF